MPSKDYLMLRSAQRACPRLELGARLEARTASLHQSTFWDSLDHPLSWLSGNTTDRPIRRPRESGGPRSKLLKSLVPASAGTTDTRTRAPDFGIGLHPAFAG